MTNTEVSANLSQSAECVMRVLFSPPDIAGEIGFEFDPTTISINSPLTADCVVATQIGRQNPRAAITWLGPDGSVVASQDNVPFETVTRQGIIQQEARLPLSFTPFRAEDIGEYSCLAMITSDSFPGARTEVFRSVEIPSVGKQPQTHTGFTRFIFIILISNHSGHLQHPSSSVSRS